jgi:hypothetical protein
MPPLDVILGMLFGLVIGAVVFGIVEHDAGVAQGRGQELCSPAIYDHWIDSHNLICKHQDGTLELHRY